MYKLLQVFGYDGPRYYSPRYYLGTVTYLYFSKEVKKCRKKRVEAKSDITRAYWCFRLGIIEALFYLV